MKKIKTFKVYEAYKGWENYPSFSNKRKIEFRKMEVAEETKDFYIIEDAKGVYSKAEPKGNWRKTKKDATKLWIENEIKRIEDSYKESIKYAEERKKSDTKTLEYVTKKAKL